MIYDISLAAAQRGERYARIFHDLTALVPTVAGAPKILGPIYGASMCDRAIKVMRAFDRLMIGLEDAVTGTQWKALDRSCHDHSYRASRPRDTLRARAGNKPISVDDIRYTVSRALMPPLSLAEHCLLGADLKAIHSAMVTAGCDIGNAGGKRRGDLVRHVRKVERVLLTLRSHLDSAVQREYPTDDANWHNLASIYFGASYGEGSISNAA